MHEEAGDEEERPHVERVNPIFQRIVPWRSETCAAMADNDEQQRDGDPDIDQEESSFSRMAVHC